MHPAVEAGTDGQLPDLPPYVPGDRDARLRHVAGKAAGGASQLVVVVGGSSTGKTRACREMLASLPGPHRRPGRLGGCWPHCAAVCRSGFCGTRSTRPRRRPS